MMVSTREFNEVFMGFSQRLYFEFWLKQVEVDLN